jgi:adenine deaminase
VREAIRLGVKPEQAWSMGSLHGATRFGMGDEIGGLGGGRRADLVLLDDSLKPVNTWYGGELVVEDRKITPILDETLNQRYRYPEAAYNTVHLPTGLKLIPDMPTKPVTANVIGIELPGIELPFRQVPITPEADWPTLLDKHNLTFVTIVERHGKTRGGIAHGFLQDFGLKNGAVASSVGHDSHNIIIAGTNEADMAIALEAIDAAKGGIVVVQDGKVTAFVALPVAGLISDKRISEVAAETVLLKQAWAAAGCTIPYMGFNLIPLSVIPQVRITDKGLVRVPEMTLAPLYE